ncbi:MAG: type II toxin-antitoxin system VapB family antitoxin [Acidobacteriota bacterium]
MKRTNLVLDGDVLEEARRTLGARTYSETVNKALAEAIRVARVRQIPELLGKMKWIGNLSEMREDQPVVPALSRVKQAPTKPTRPRVTAASGKTSR